MRIIWLTGQSGAGKTTLAKKLQDEWPCIILDGNEMRQSISVGAGFSKKDRAEHNYRVARLAKILSKQTNVAVSVIAPLKDVRSAISKDIPQVEWIYVKRTLPAREGHFYQPPSDYPVLDHDKLSPDESFALLKTILGIEKKVYSLFIGRYQPPHLGHFALFDAVRKEGKNICIAVRDTEISKENPYTLAERMAMIKKSAPDAKVIAIPDIDEVVYGRSVGWRIRQIRLSSDIESISATKIRNEHN